MPLPHHAAGVPSHTPLPPGLANLHQQQQQAVHAHHMNQLHRQNHVLQQQLIPSVQRLQEQLQGQQRLHQEILAQQQQRAQGSPRAGSPFQLAQFPPHLNMPVQPQVPAVHQSFQNIIGQYQRDRAAMGLHGAQQGIPSPTQTRSQSPSASRSFRQEGIGPNGERWQVTLNQTTTYLPADQTHGFSLGQGPRQSSQVIQGPGVRDIQNVIRAGDLQAAQQCDSKPIINSSNSIVQQRHSWAAFIWHTSRDYCFYSRPNSQLSYFNRTTTFNSSASHCS